MKAPEPPNYRRSKNPDERCGLCRMDWRSLCWGYGNYRVDAMGVCDSFEAERGGSKDPQERVKELWAKHRKELANG